MMEWEVAKQIQHKQQLHVVETRKTTKKERRKSSFWTTTTKNNNQTDTRTHTHTGLEHGCDMDMFFFFFFVSYSIKNETRKERTVWIWWLGTMNAFDERSVECLPGLRFRRVRLFRKSKISNHGPTMSPLNDSIITMWKKKKR